jgi:multidrug transporter EmrE-like cation transporter
LTIKANDIFRTTATITGELDLAWQCWFLNTHNSRKKVGTYLLILPIALIVTYSQLIVKWRSNSMENFVASSFSQQLVRFLTDPMILSAYAAALIASFAWLYVVTKLPLTVAFPVYIGVTFAMVLLGGWFFLGETLTATKVVAIMLIMGGIVLGVTADA